MSGIVTWSSVTRCEHSAPAQLYRADREAPHGGAVQLPQLRLQLQAVPDLELWRDAGFAAAAAAEALRGQLGPLAERVVLVFGSESRGLPESLLTKHAEHTLRIPIRDAVRSLNLSNAVAVAAYETLRQWV